MKKLFTILTTILLFAGIANSQTFTTIADGNVSDPAIWSIDGGVTPCNCSPTTELPSVSVINLGSVHIFHEVNLPKNTIILGVGLVATVHPGASMTGNIDLEVRSGVLYNYGSVDVADILVYNSGYMHSVGTLTVNPGNLTNGFQGRMDLGGQVFVPNGNMPNEGWIDILANAQISIGGSVTNQGYVDIEPGACINIFGGFTNDLEVNLINGPGSAYIESGGNITNLGVWDTDVDWCAAGSGTGLTHSSNCSNCTLLPVELTHFDAEIQHGEVILRWITTTEVSNSHFTIERSSDGNRFEMLSQTASNSPMEGKTYESFDSQPFYGISWYRLSQTDQNGTTRKLKTVMIHNQTGPDHNFQVFPDPFEDRIRVTTFGLEGKAVDIRLSNLAGTEIMRMEIQSASNDAVYELTPGDLPLGVYVVTIKSAKYVESFKVLHR